MKTTSNGIEFPEPAFFIPTCEGNWQPQAGDLNTATKICLKVLPLACTLSAPPVAQMLSDTFSATRRSSKATCCHGRHWQRRRVGGVAAACQREEVKVPWRGCFTNLYWNQPWHSSSKFEMI